MANNEQQDPSIAAVAAGNLAQGVQIPRSSGPMINDGVMAALQRIEVLERRLGIHTQMNMSLGVRLDDLEGRAKTCENMRDLTRGMIHGLDERLMRLEAETRRLVTLVGDVMDRITKKLEGTNDG